MHVVEVQRYLLLLLLAEVLVGVLTAVEQGTTAIWRDGTSLRHHDLALSTRRQLRLLRHFLLVFLFAIFLRFIAVVPDDGHRTVHDHVTQLWVEVALINRLVQMHPPTVPTARRHREFVGYTEGALLAVDHLLELALEAFIFIFIGALDRL